jgi:hypothetical protein
MVSKELVYSHKTVPLSAASARLSCITPRRQRGVKGVLCVGYVYVEADGRPLEMHGLDSNAAAQYSCLDLCSKSLATRLPLEFSEAVTVRMRKIITTTAYIYLYGRFNSRKVLVECSLIKKKTELFINEMYTLCIQPTSRHQVIRS